MGLLCIVLYIVKKMHRCPSGRDAGLKNRLAQSHSKILKPKSCDTNCVVAGGTGGCQNNNLPGHQAWQVWHHNTSSVSVKQHIASKINVNLRYIEFKTERLHLQSEMFYIASEITSVSLNDFIFQKSSLCQVKTWYRKGDKRPKKKRKRNRSIIWAKDDTLRCHMYASPTLDYWLNLCTSLAIPEYEIHV